MIVIIKKGDKVLDFHAKTPEGAFLWCFLFRLCKVAYAFRLLPLFISIQPFANIVSHYTRHNRDEKGDKYIVQDFHLLPAGKVNGKFIIS